MSKNTTEVICELCGKKFIHICTGTKLPKLCPNCLNIKIKKRREEIEERKQKLNNEKWQNDCKKFEIQLLKRDTISLENIILNEKTLYIIGNGFDLMHGVKSSYYAFRDFLGKRKLSLKRTLEEYIISRDIWANFESSLGKINLDMIASYDVIGTSLDVSGFLEDIDSDSKYFLAKDFAIAPMVEMTEELEKYFRIWVKRLEIGTSDRPLSSIIYNGKVLSFNYTEFIETMYGISKENVCYIHGCRKNRKEKLILGHESDIEHKKISCSKKKKSKYDILNEILQEDVLNDFFTYDKNITKDSISIIKLHQDFFKNLKDIENVVIIGHSLSKVDWNYFIEISKNIENANWYFSCHSYQDLKNIDDLSAELSIKPIIFRTDNINVSLIPIKENTMKCDKKNHKLLQCFSENCRVQWFGKDLKIIKDNNVVEYIMQENIRKCVFSPDGTILFVMLKGYGRKLSFFRLVSETWSYVSEIEFNQTQSIFNRRLNYVYLNNDIITFVYNNRIKEYSLENGKIISNIAKRHAKDYSYPGINITDLFM